MRNDGIVFCQHILLPFTITCLTVTVKYIHLSKKKEFAPPRSILLEVTTRGLLRVQHLFLSSLSNLALSTTHYFKLPALRKELE